MKRRGRPRKSRHKHRIPPMPKWFRSAPWGTCRWCNQDILKDDGKTINKRRRWHPGCLHEYLICTDHRYAKRQVKKRDKGICAHCSKYCHYRYEWQCDHILPLIDCPRRRKYWTLLNLQTLCNKCHKKKTDKENAERKKKWAAEKKARKCNWKK